MYTLTKRGKIWWYSFTIEGKRIRRSAKTSDKEEAAEIAAKEQWRHRRIAVHGPESVITFGEAAVLYCKSGKDPRFLDKLLKKWRHNKIVDLRPTVVQQGAKEIYPNRSSATWNRQVITPTRAIINYAADNGLCSHIRIKRFKETPKKRKAADGLWVEKFRNACTQPNLAALCRFMFETGTRIGNSTALTWNDVDLNEGTAYFGKTKNGDDHTAYLSPDLVTELANLKTVEKVFGYSSRHTASKAWDRVIVRAGIDRFTPHEAGRHGFATEMIVRNGIDIPTVAKLGNWKSHRLLSETYAHPENERATILKVFGNKK